MEIKSCAKEIILKLLIACCLIDSNVHSTAFQNSTEVQLYDDLFTGYKRFLRPIKGDNYFKQIVVNVSFVINQVERLNERDQKMTAHGYMSLIWKDDFLTWNATDYNGAFFLVVPAEQVWLPEISPINSLLGDTELKSLDEDTRVRISNDGTVLWIPSLKWDTTCSVDLTDFPYDNQTCEIIYANWMYTARIVNFTVQPEVSTTGLLPNLEWAVTGTHAWTEERYHIDGTIIPFVKVKIYLKRDPTFFELNVLVPSMLLSILMIPMFVLPVESGEKVSLGVTLMLAYSIFLLMMTDVTPKSGTTPRLTRLILICIVFSSMSILLSVVIINIHNHCPDKPVPRWIKRLIIGKGGRLLCCMNYYNSQELKPAEENNGIIEIPSNGEGEKPILSLGKDFSSCLNEINKNLEFFKSIKINEESIENNKDDWNKVARVLDRFFLCCSAVFVVCTIATVVALKFTLGN